MRKAGRGEDGVDLDNRDGCQHPDGDDGEPDGRDSREFADHQFARADACQDRLQKFVGALLDEPLEHHGASDDRGCEQQIGEAEGQQGMGEGRGSGGVCLGGRDGNGCAEGLDAGGGKRIDAGGLERLEAQAAREFELDVLHEGRASRSAGPDADLTAGVDIRRNVDSNRQDCAPGGTAGLLKVGSDGSAKASGVASVDGLREGQFHEWARGRLKRRRAGR